MAVYFRGSRCGKYIKVGVTEGATPNGRYGAYEKNAHRFIEFSHPLAYFTTKGSDDREAETRIKKYFFQYLVNEKRHGDEVFHAEALLPYISWLRLQWFTEIDPSGNSAPDPAEWSEINPSAERTSLQRKEEDLTTHLEADENPFWFLPDTAVEPDEDFFTPAAFIEPVRVAFGGVIDLDVASHPKANRTVQARHYFTKSMNGLELPWHGRVWLSPRTKDMEAWARKAVSEWSFRNIDEMICLIKSRPCASNYFKPLLECASALCIITGGGPVFEGRGALTENNSTDRWHFIYFGFNVRNFMQAMKDVGVCFERGAQ